MDKKDAERNCLLKVKVRKTKREKFVKLLSECETRFGSNFGLKAVFPTTSKTRSLEDKLYIKNKTNKRAFYTY